MIRQSPSQPARRALARLAFYCLGLSILPAGAELLLYEPFDYDEGSIVGQGGGETGFVADSTWVRTSTKTTEVLVDSMEFGSLVTTGNKFHYTDGSSQKNRNCSRPMSAVAADGELYITFLMQGPNGGRLSGGVYVNGSALQEFGALRSEYNTLNTNGVIPPHVYYGGEASVAPGNPLTATTYMYVQKYTGLGSADGGTAQLWIIDATHYDTIAADGVVTIDELDANNHLTTPLLTLAGEAPTLDATENLRIHLHDNGSGTADFLLDEIRVATSLGEAMDIPPGIGLAGELAITDFSLTRTADPDNVLVSVTFTSGESKTYSVFATDDLAVPVSERIEIDDSVQGAADTTTFEFDFSTHSIPLDAARQFFVVKENP